MAVRTDLGQVPIGETFVSRVTWSAAPTASTVTAAVRPIGGTVTEYVYGTDEELEQESTTEYLLRLNALEGPYEVDWQATRTAAGNTYTAIAPARIEFVHSGYEA